MLTEGQAVDGLRRRATDQAAVLHPPGAHRRVPAVRQLAVRDVVEVLLEPVGLLGAGLVDGDGAGLQRCGVGSRVALSDEDRVGEAEGAVVLRDVASLVTPGDDLGAQEVAGLDIDGEGDRTGPVVEGV